MHRDFIGIEIDKLFIPFIGKIKNDIENNLIDKDVWKRASKKTKNDGIYAPLVLTILSAILCYGLADKIYV